MNDFQNKKILIVEDRPEYEERLRKFLAQKKLSYISALDDYGDEDVDFSDEDAVSMYLERINVPKIVNILNNYEPDLILLDLAWNVQESEIFGKLLSTSDIMPLWRQLKQNKEVPKVFNLIEYLDEQLKFIPVIILTDWHQEVKLIFNTIYKGRADHIIIKKPQTDWIERFDKELWPEIKRCLNAKKFVDNAKELLIGESSSNIKLFNIAMQAANTNEPILIIGENGIGKTVFAEAIHQISQRAEGPFIDRNISSIPKDMAYSILFGHKKGSFTGAITDQKGILEAGHKGTVFLDEIGDLPLDEQKILLKAIEEKKVVPLGENEERKVDVRFIFATNKDLPKMLRDNLFRTDLYYRINHFVLKMDPLRERKKDIPKLVKYFYKEYSKKCSGMIREPTNKEILAVQDYNFPGNIRQLLTIIKRAISLDIPLEDSLAMEEKVEIESTMKIYDIITFLWNRMCEREYGLNDIIEEIEAQMIERALLKGHKNSEAAKLLKLKLGTFEVKKKKFKNKEINHETNQL
jgi:DNA-binding NtrC family response regulator